MAKGPKLPVTLSDLVTGVRQNSNTINRYISEVLSDIRREVNSPEVSSKVEPIRKLSYLYLLGVDIGWSSFNALEVMSSHQYYEKRVGYLGATLSFQSDQAMNTLSSNLILGDLQQYLRALESTQSIDDLPIEKIERSCCLALSTLSVVADSDQGTTLFPVVLSLLRAKGASVAVQKRALACLTRILKKILENPELNNRSVSQDTEASGHLARFMEALNDVVFRAEFNSICVISPTITQQTGVRSINVVDSSISDFRNQAHVDQSERGLNFMLAWVAVMCILELYRISPGDVQQYIPMVVDTIVKPFISAVGSKSANNSADSTTQLVPNSKFYTAKTHICVLRLLSTVFASTSSANFASLLKNYILCVLDGREVASVHSLIIECGHAVATMAVSLYSSNMGFSGEMTELLTAILVYLRVYIPTIEDIMLNHAGKELPHNAILSKNQTNITASLLRNDQNLTLLSLQFYGVFAKTYPNILFRDQAVCLDILSCLAHKDLDVRMTALEVVAEMTNKRQAKKILLKLVELINDVDAFNEALAGQYAELQELRVKELQDNQRRIERDEMEKLRRAEQEKQAAIWESDQMANANSHADQSLQSPGPINPWDIEDFNEGASNNNTIGVSPTVFDSNTGFDNGYTSPTINTSADAESVAKDGSDYLADSDYRASGSVSSVQYKKEQKIREREEKRKEKERQKFVRSVAEPTTRKTTLDGSGPTVHRKSQKVPVVSAITPSQKLFASTDGKKPKEEIKRAAFLNSLEAYNESNIKTSVQAIIFKHKVTETVLTIIVKVASEMQNISELGDIVDILLCLLRDQPSTTANSVATALFHLLAKIPANIGIQGNVAELFFKKLILTTERGVSNIVTMAQDSTRIDNKAKVILRNTNNATFFNSDDAENNINMTVILPSETIPYSSLSGAVTRGSVRNSMGKLANETGVYSRILSTDGSSLDLAFDVMKEYEKSNVLRACVVLPPEEDGMSDKARDNLLSELNYFLANIDQSSLNSVLCTASQAIKSGLQSRNSIQAVLSTSANAIFLDTYIRPVQLGTLIESKYVKNSVSLNNACKCSIDSNFSTSVVSNSLSGRSNAHRFLEDLGHDGISRLCGITVWAFGEFGFVSEMNINIFLAAIEKLTNPITVYSLPVDIQLIFITSAIKLIAKSTRIVKGYTEKAITLEAAIKANKEELNIVTARLAANDNYEDQQNDVRLRTTIQRTQDDILLLNENIYEIGKAIDKTLHLVLYRFINFFINETLSYFSNVSDVCRKALIMFTKCYSDIIGLVKQATSNYIKHNGEEKSEKEEETEQKGLANEIRLGKKLMSKLLYMIEHDGVLVDTKASENGASTSTEDKTSYFDILITKAEEKAKEEVYDVEAELKKEKEETEKTDTVNLDDKEDKNENEDKIEVNEEKISSLHDRFLMAAHLSNPMNLFISPCSSKVVPKPEFAFDLDDGFDMENTTEEQRLAWKRFVSCTSFSVNHAYFSDETGTQYEPCSILTNLDYSYEPLEVRGSLNNFIRRKEDIAFTGSLSSANIKKISASKQAMINFKAARMERAKRIQSYQTGSFGRNFGAPQQLSVLPTETKQTASQIVANSPYSNLPEVMNDVSNGLINNAVAARQASYGDKNASKFILGGSQKLNSSPAVSQTNPFGSSGMNDLFGDKNGSFDIYGRNKSSIPLKIGQPRAGRLSLNESLPKSRTLDTASIFANSNRQDSYAPPTISVPAAPVAEPKSAITEEIPVPTKPQEQHQIEEAGEKKHKRRRKTTNVEAAQPTPDDEVQEVPILQDKPAIVTSKAIPIQEQITAVQLKTEPVANDADVMEDLFGDMMAVSTPTTVPTNNYSKAVNNTPITSPIPKQETTPVAQPAPSAANNDIGDILDLFG